MLAANGDRHAAAPAELALGAVPGRAGESQRAGRVVTSCSIPTRWCAASSTGRSAATAGRSAAASSARSSTRPTSRAASCAATRSRWRAGSSPIASAYGGSIGDRVPWGREHRRALRRALRPHDHRRRSSARICPSRTNRVDLDPALADGHGIPAPRVSYALSENSRRMLDHGIARGARGAGGGRRPRGRRQSAPAGRRLASHGHGAHGARSGHLGDRRRGPMPRRAQSLRRRRERDGDLRRREPDLDDPGGGPLHRRRDDPEAARDAGPTRGDGATCWLRCSTPWCRRSDGFRARRGGARPRARDRRAPPPSRVVARSRARARIESGRR